MNIVTALMEFFFVFIAAVFINVIECRQILTVSNITETKMHVEWTAIKIPDKVIEKYQVSAYPIKSFGEMDSLNRNEWTFYNTTRNSDLLGLHPGTQYNVSVWGITSEGQTDPVTEIVWTEVGAPEEPPQVEVIERTGKTLSIKLPLVQSYKGPISNYYIVTVEEGPVVFLSEELGNFSYYQETGVPYYIAANLTLAEVGDRFIVGDGRTYNGFYNAPLVEHRKYQVIIGAASALNGVTKVSYSKLSSSSSTMENESDDGVTKAQTSSALSVILSAGIGVFGFLLVLSVIIYFLLRKHYRKRRASDEMILRAQGSDADISSMNGLHLPDDVDLDEVYERIQEQYWNIPRLSLEVRQTVLGIGQFGEVREGVVHRKTKPVECIVQQTQTPSMLPDKEQRNILCEMDKISRIGYHKHLVEFLGVCDDRDILQIAIQHTPSSLRGMLLRSRQQPPDQPTTLTENTFLELAAGIAHGMAHLSEKGILHRHLSTRNVLIDEYSVPRIAHFGLGYFDPLGKKLMYSRWTAPEVSNLSTFTSKSDVWSFGVLLWEMFTLGGSPYVQLPTRDILPRLMQGMRLPHPLGISDWLYQLMLNCWQLDSDERPSFSELACDLQQSLTARGASDTVMINGCANYQFYKFDPSAEDQ